MAAILMVSVTLFFSSKKLMTTFILFIFSHRLWRMMTFLDVVSRITPGDTLQRVTPK